MSQDPISIVGQNESDDWQLRPTIHARNLPPEAGALKRVLEQPKIEDIISRFYTADAKAIRSQKWYRFWGRAGIYAIALASIIGTALVLRLDEKFGVESKWLALAVEYGLLVIAFLIAQWLVIKQPFKKWMENRGIAEITRIQLFDEVVQTDEPLMSEETALLPLQLEYFRRYQLDVQLAYYKGRGSQHLAAAGHTNLWKLLSVGLTCVWVLITVVASLHFLAEQDWITLPSWAAALKLSSYERVVMAFGIVAASIYTANYARSLMDLDERNAARYATTLANLEHIQSTLLGEAREAAQQGDRSKVLTFVRLVQNQISSEHQEWVNIRDIAPDANALLAYGGAPVMVRGRE